MSERTERGPIAVLAEYQSSNSDAVYQVRIGGDGVLYCTCPGWVFRTKRGGGDCKHLARYKAEHPNWRSQLP